MSRSPNPSKEWWRVLALESATVIGMIGLGWEALTIALVRDPGIRSLVGLEGYFPATIVAAVVGLITSPFVTALLWNTRLSASLSFVFGWTAVVTAIWTILIPDVFGLTAAAPAFVSALALSGISCGRHDDPARRKRNICPKCGYDLRGCTQPGCPECGWGRDTSS